MAVLLEARLLTRAESDADGLNSALVYLLRRSEPVDEGGACVIFRRDPWRELRATRGGATAFLEGSWRAAIRALRRSCWEIAGDGEMSVDCVLRSMLVFNVALS